MQRIHLAGASFVTSDAVAHGLLQYARALAVVLESDVVQVPVLVPGVGVRTAEMLLGPGIGLSALPEPPSAADDEEIGLEVAAQFESDARRTASSRGSIEADPCDAGPDVDPFDS